MSKWWEEAFKSEAVKAIAVTPISQESWAAVVVQGHVTRAAIERLIELLTVGLDTWPEDNKQPPGEGYAPRICAECGKYQADTPSKICVGCAAHKEHTAI